MFTTTTTTTIPTTSAVQSVIDTLIAMGCEIVVMPKYRGSVEVCFILRSSEWFCGAVVVSPRSGRCLRVVMNDSHRFSLSEFRQTLRILRGAA